MKTHKDETALSVADYVEDSGAESAFDLAREDTEGAVKQVQAELHEVLTIDEIDQLTITAEFLEFDSGNWTHAGAYFAIEISGPDELVDKAAALWVEFREPCPPGGEDDTTQVPGTHGSI